MAQINFNVFGHGGTVIFGKADLAIPGLIWTPGTARFGIVEAGCRIVQSVSAGCAVFGTVAAGCGVRSTVEASADVRGTVESDCNVFPTVSATGKIE